MGEGEREHKTTQEQNENGREKEGRTKKSEISPVCYHGDTCDIHSNETKYRRMVVKSELLSEKKVKKDCCNQGGPEKCKKGGGRGGKKEYKMEKSAKVSKQKLYIQTGAL